MLTTSFLAFGLQLVATVSALPSNEKRQSEIECSRVFTTAASDTCDGIVNRFGITLENFTTWNPALGANCAGFVGGKLYCIRATVSQGSVTSSSAPATIPGAPTTSTTAGPAPTPDKTSKDGSCGGTASLTCTGATFGKCCSVAGWCGDTDGHCKAGCQPLFGTCTKVADNISIDGSCGANGKTCKGSAYGDCCSVAGWCGNTFDHCNNGCQSAFGTCSVAFTTTTSKPAPTPTSNVSQNGACGANVGKTCLGSAFGDCCSRVGFCGKTIDHCDRSSGCQTGFGTCTTNNFSIDGRCGAFNGRTCVGSTYGNCCSSQGYCGKETSHCAEGCQRGSSSQCLTSNIPSLTGVCGKNGIVCAGGPFSGTCCSVNGFCGRGTGFPC